MAQDLASKKMTTEQLTPFEKTKRKMGMDLQSKKNRETNKIRNPCCQSEKVQVYQPWLKTWLPRGWQLSSLHHEEKTKQRDQQDKESLLSTPLIEKWGFVK